MIPHGTSGGYSNHSCRCTLCTNANREKQNARTARVRADRVLVDGRLTHPNAVHGTYGKGYIGWQCRCLPCMEANRMQQQQRRRGLPVSFPGEDVA